MGAASSLTRLAMWATIAVVALAVLWIGCLHPGINTYYRAKFDDMLEGTAYNPFVQRRLVPALVRLSSLAIPRGVAEDVEGRVRECRLARRAFEELHWEPRQAVRYFIAAAVLYGCLIGFVRGLLYLLDGLVVTAPGFRWITGVVALLGLPPLFKFQVYLYDFAVLFLFTLGLALMLRGKWTAYFLIYCLACSNKETAVLLAVVFALTHWTGREARKVWFYGFLGLQLAVAAAIKLLTWSAFYENPGPTLEFNLWLNLRLMTPYSIATLMAWLAVGLLVAFRWAAKPIFLRRALWIAVPLLGTVPFFGATNEWRACFELYPIVLLLAALTFAPGVLPEAWETRSQGAVVAAPRV